VLVLTLRTVYTEAEIVVNALLLVLALLRLISKLIIAILVCMSFLLLLLEHTRVLQIHVRIKRKSS